MVICCCRVYLDWLLWMQTGTRTPPPQPCRQRESASNCFSQLRVFCVQIELNFVHLLMVSLVCFRLFSISFWYFHIHIHIYYI